MIKLPPPFISPLAVLAGAVAAEDYALVRGLIAAPAPKQKEVEHVE